MSGFGPTGARFMFASDSKKARAGAIRILLPPFRSSLVLSEMVRLTCTREDPTTVTPASVAKQHNEPFLCFSAWVLPHTREDPTTVTPASVAKQQKNLSCVFSQFLHGLYLTCTREDPTTVTPASVAQQHNKPFLCLRWPGPEPSQFSFCRLVRFPLCLTWSGLLPFRSFSGRCLSKMARAGGIAIFLLPSRSFSVLSKMVRAGAIRILLLPFRSFSLRCLSKMARAGAIRILLPPFVRFQFGLRLSGPEPSELRLFSVCPRWPGRKPSEFSFCPFARFQFCLTRSGPEPSEFSFCLFVRFLFV